MTPMPIWNLCTNLRNGGGTEAVIGWLGQAIIDVSMVANEAFNAIAESRYASDCAVATTHLKLSDEFTLAHAVFA